MVVGSLTQKIQGHCIESFLWQRRNSLYEPDFETSVVYNNQEKELRILFDSGRCIRPVYLVDDGKINIPDQLPNRFSDLIKNGVMEYIDPAEEDYTLIATDMNMLNDEQIQDILVALLMWRLILFRYLELPHQLFLSSQ